MLASAELTNASDLSSHIDGLGDLWKQTQGDERVLIAVLDGPVNTNHSSFHGAKVEVFGDANSLDSASVHGTHIASVIVGQRGGPVQGIAPQCSLVSLPIFKSDSNGDVVPCSQPQLAEAIRKAEELADQRKAAALVINISGGQFTQSGDAHPALSAAVAECDRERTLIVAAAGNQGCKCLHVPGALPSVLAVGAMGRNGDPLEFSNWGEQYLEQGVLAIGEDILGALPSGGTTTNTGTSYATPIVSGVAALLLSLQLRKGLRPSAAHVRSVILKAALGCEHQKIPNCKKLLAGRLSVVGTIQYINSGDSSSMKQEQTVRPVVPSSCELEAQTEATSDVVETSVTQDPVALEAVPTTEPEVVPADCGCGGGGKYGIGGPKGIFAIGRLSYDFPSFAVRQSVQNRIKDLNGVVQDPESLMRHLFQLNVDGSGRQELNLHEASRVYWVLEYSGVPQYVIRPMGIAARDDLTTMVFDYMEQQGLADEDRNFLVAVGNDAPRLDVVKRPDHFAISGYVTGEVAFLVDSGRTVPVLVPEYDLTDTWNLDAVLDDAISNGVIDGNDEERVSQFRRTASALYSYIDPKGDTPEGRAMNFIASASVLFAAQTEFLQGRVALKGFSPPVRIASRREEELVYEIVAHYFDVTNVHNANYHRRYRVNVTEPKPYLEGVTELGFGSSQFV